MMVYLDVYTALASMMCVLRSCYHKLHPMGEKILRQFSAWKVKVGCICIL